MKLLYVALVSLLVLTCCNVVSDPGSISQTGSGVSVLLPVSFLFMTFCTLVLLFILFQRNRSEGKRLERQITERTEELNKSLYDLEKALETERAANYSKTVFLANMSHEIRTPMNSIVGFSELALDGEPSIKTRDYLSKIQANAVWLLQIINDILDISKIESGKMELENIPFDLHELFSSCRSLVMPKAVEKGIMLHFYAEPSIGRKPLGDPTRLRQVFVNLLTNSIKFANSGMVKLLSDIAHVDENSITMHFEIKDSGIGMTSEQIQKIFDPFTQAETGITRRYGGTGLGLAITRSIVEKMGGALSVESTPGVGTKFCFDLTFSTINIADEADYEKNYTLKEIEKPAFEGEVLICEDNEMNQLVIREHLTRIGLKTVVVDNGKKGVDLIKERMEKGEKQFDLILMDIHMPVMDGIDASQIIINMNIGIPIVAMTANIMSDDMDVYQKSGMQECLSKPFTSQELWHCLLKYFNMLETKPEQLEEDFQDNNETVFQLSLKELYIKNNGNKYNEIIEAIEKGNIKSAHMLAHTLKSNSAQIGMNDLQKTAADIELQLKNENNVSPQLLASLETELKTAVAQLTKQIAAIRANQPPGISSEKDGSEIVIDKKSALELLDALEQMLRQGNTESLKSINKVREVPADDSLKNALIQQIEDFEFESAMITIQGLKNSLGNNDVSA